MSNRSSDAVTNWTDKLQQAPGDEVGISVTDIHSKIHKAIVRDKNDILRQRPPDQYAEVLDRLMARVCQWDKPIYLMEMALTPLNFEYGRVMRRISAQHKIRLIPRFHLMNLLTGEANTLDGIHLSKKGHRQFADKLGKLLVR